ncbi:PhzF family phenazine biosynthesis protein [Larkinella soli]|uniref:PhzF family phenazine biosynthesis protein n=1 Tax=Larkinella soli TaxID=1770527 RepID=UPI000FFBD691|nr:PhzF family phenazine biosynthesis protein [Larkinella soli]
MNVPYFQVDAFTDRAFAGNPAGVCLLDDVLLTDDQLRSVAAEINQSETAFLWPEQDGFRLRWFTPTVEVELCGHATLASANVLWQTGRIAPGTPIRFQTLSGELRATAGPGDWIELDFPARFGSRADLPEGLPKALGVRPVSAYFMHDRYLIEVTTEEEVRTMAPDFRALAQFDNTIVTARANPGSGFDFISRFFAPKSGIDEDPVTGSAHCCLATYWSDRLGKTDFLAYQASQRGGILKVSLQGERVKLAGRAVTLIEGMLRLPAN